MLAAGMSTRMGRIKQLLPVPDQHKAGSKIPLIVRMIEQAALSGLEHIVVVLGHEAETIQKAISPLVEEHGLAVVINQHYAKGMSTSIKAGLGVVEKTHAHAMILLADMLHIDAHLIDLLLRGYLGSGAKLGAVRIEGKRSHPVIFSRALFAELYSLEGDIGGRELFEHHHKEAFLLDAPPGYKVLDLDTPEDYSSLLSAQPSSQPGSLK